MSLNAKRLIAAATRNIAADCLKLTEYNKERFHVKRAARPVFTKAEQLRRRSDLACFDRVVPQPLPAYPSEVLWESLERRAMLRRENRCPICFDALGRLSVVICSCGHFFHARCVERAGAAQSCPMCRVVVYFRDSVALVAFSRALAAVTLQTAFRVYFARGCARARRIVADGTFSLHVEDVYAASDRLTDGAGFVAAAEYAQGMQDAQDAARLFDDLLRMRNTRAWDVVYKARARKAHTCPVCLEQISGFVLAEAASSEAKAAITGYEIPKAAANAGFLAVSCCGSVYHAQCLKEAEKARDTCAYCRAAYYAVAVELG